MREILHLTLLASFLTFSSGIELYCNFRNFGWGPPVESAYTCYLPAVTIVSNSTTVNVVFGIHDGNNNNTDVKGLLVSDEATLQRIPGGIDAFFPNLEALAWEYGNLTSITADDLQPFPELKLLYFGSNMIVSLDSDLFQFPHMLSLIYFGRNLIENVGLDLLANMTDLTSAYFYENPCIDFNAETPQEIQELQERLVAQCPPWSPTTTMSPTTEEFCDVRCTMNDEVDEMKVILDQQSDLIAENSERIRVLEELAVESEELALRNERRIQALENQLREVLANNH